MKYSEIVKNFNPNITFGTETFYSDLHVQYIQRICHENDLYKNSFDVFSEKYYSKIQSPIDLGQHVMNCPNDNMYILRMPIKHNRRWKIPTELLFLKSFIKYCKSYVFDHLNDIKYNYVYLTVRHGPQLDQLTDVWHVDGFQGNPAERHIPEVSFLWVDKSPTEWAIQQFDIPGSFDPTKHNFFNIIDPQVKIIRQTPMNHIIMFNPYMVHRKAKSVWSKTMVRLTFSPVEIKDPNFTHNPHFNLSYNKTEPRDELI